MKLAGRRLEAFLRTPDPAIVVVLLYGPDLGLVRERAEHIVAALAGDAADPFRVVEISADLLKDDRCRLADEAATVPFGGGRRVVRVRDGRDAIAPAVRVVLENGSDAGVVVVEAAELGPRSTLRSVCEGEERAVAIPCYLDEGESLRRLVGDDLRARGLTLDPGAAELLETHLGADRGLTRQELEKLALYVGDGGHVGIDDVRAVVCGAGGVVLDAIAFAAAGGAHGALDSSLGQASAEGVSPITLLRVVARHLERLIQARAVIAGGSSVARAMEGLKPAVFFRLQAEFRRQLERWTIDDLTLALVTVVEAELRCKASHARPDLVCHAALLEVADILAGTRARG